MTDHRAEGSPTTGELLRVREAHRAYVESYPALKAAVAEARAAGASWGQIAKACGVPRATAQRWA